MEIWNPGAGRHREYKFIDWYREHPFADDLAMLKRSDDVLEGQGYVAWYPFEHPEVGHVELGGWNALYAFRNPPPAFLERNWRASPGCSGIWPFRRAWNYSARVTPLGDDNYRITLAVHNTGWLPTYVTKRALERKAVRGVVADRRARRRHAHDRQGPRGAWPARGGVPISTAHPWASVLATRPAIAPGRVGDARWPTPGSLTARHPRAGVVRRGDARLMRPWLRIDWRFMTSMVSPPVQSCYTDSTMHRCF